VTRGQLPQRAGSLGLTAVGLPPRYRTARKRGAWAYSTTSGSDIHMNLFSQFVSEEV